MKSLEQWFSNYGESHQNNTNIIIHKIAVPLIYFSVIALFTAIPGLIGTVILSVLACVVLGFYFYLNFKLGVVMSIFTALCIYCSWLITSNLVWVALAIFIVAWIFQFIGHKIEGKKPSFVDDLSFLLIGPAWVFNPIFAFDKK